MLTIPPLTVLSVAPLQHPQTGVPQPTGQLFTPGQILKATVLEARADSRFLLEAGGNRVLIQSQASLAVGQMLDVEVGGNASRLEFQILPATVDQLFGQALTSVAKNHDLTSIFSIFKNIPASQLENLNSTSRQAFESFSRLLLSTSPQQPGGSQPSAPDILNRFFGQAAAQLNTLLAAGNQEAAVNGLKSVIRDIAQFFVTRGELNSSPAAEPAGKLSVAGKQILESLFTLQKDAVQPTSTRPGDPSPAIRSFEAAANAILERLGINPQNPFVQGKAETPLGVMNKGLAELFFLLKSPESITQLFTSPLLRGGLLSDAQLQNPALMGTRLPLVGDSRGQALKELVTRLGLDLENLLAGGNKEAAVKTVKLALLDLLQNAQGSKFVQETGQKAVQTLEFYQLAQLQLLRDDVFIFPLPLPFLQKGYLVVEDYPDKDGAKDGGKSTNTRFSLYLSLQELGNLKIDFHNDDFGLSIRFSCESKQTAEFIAGYRDELKSNLSKVHVKEISFSDGADDPLAELVKKCVPKGKSFFNVKA
jgi:hypothetical protein